MMTLDVKDALNALYVYMLNVLVFFKQHPDS